MALLEVQTRHAMTSPATNRCDHITREAHNRLRAEMVDALRTDPDRLVCTPSFADHCVLPASNAVLYVYNARPQLLLETLRIVAQVARGELGYEQRHALQLCALG